MSDTSSVIPLTAMVTRPAGQAEALLDAIRAAGCAAVEFPLLEIRPVGDTHALHAALSALDRYALVVFVSPNAIDQALAYRDTIGVSWPAQVPLGVVGPGSVRALAQWGIAAPRYRVIAPAGAAEQASRAATQPLAAADEAAAQARYDSEALLEALEQALQLETLAGREVLLVRGDGGRELLADSLRAMGVIVSTVTAYHRSAPQLEASLWQALAQRLEQAPERVVWLFTSSEGVRYLQQMGRTALSAAHYTALMRSRVIAPHARIGETARSLGFDTITISGAGDRNIVSALLSLATLQATQLAPRRMTDTHDTPLDPTPAAASAGASSSAAASDTASPSATPDTSAARRRPGVASGAAPVDAAASLPPPASDVRAGKSTLPWVILLIVVLAAGGGGYALNRKLDRTEHALQQRQDANDARLAQTLAQAHQLDLQLNTQVGLINGKLQDSQTAQQALQQQFQDLARNRDDWTLAEIGQMLSTASEQLQLTGNVQLALFALQSADTRLATSSGPQMLTVRRAVEQDIDKLKAAPQVDLAGMAIKLDDAIAQVDTLPLVGEAQRPDAQPNPASAPLAAGAGHPATPAATPAWRAWTGGLWAEAVRDLKSLIQVRRIDDPDAMLVAPDQGYFLRANLKLRLLSARLSLLARNQTTMKSDLASASAALNRYFDPASKRVQTVRGLLQQVDQSSANVELPNLNASLAAIRQFSQFKSRS